MEKAYQRLVSFGKRLLRTSAAAFLLLPFFCVCDARSESIRLISDEETEQFLSRIIEPLFKAANLKFNRYNIFIVEDNSLNAFVADGNRLFVHTGTLIRADNANELAGVIAHETGHIMGGHILRQKLKLQDMRQVSLVSAVLAGASAALSGRGDVAMAVMLGSQSSALNHYTGYRTSEERSADEAAVTLLSATRQSPAGILNFMKKISQDNMLNGREEMPYFRTHPITTERIAFFEKAVSQTSYPETSPDDKEFLRVKAKLKAYLQPPEQTLREYPTSRNDTPARYARVIVFLKQLKFAAALQILDKLNQKEPANPFFYELKGQVLLETGKIKAAKKSFAEALRLLPHSRLMQINYAQAVLEDEPTSAEAKEAAAILNRALRQAPSGFAWMLLSKAYGITGEMAAANYAAAEYSLSIGSLPTAKKQLEQALKYPASAQLKLKIDDLKQRIKFLEKKA